MLIQGPLILDWRKRKWGLLPRIENGCIQGSQPPSLERLPLWLQAIRGVSAVKSGILILPMIGAYVLGCILAGGLVSITGFPAPAMILSGALAVVGTGLLSTLRSSSSQTAPLPFEILTGLGVGIGMQQPILAAQAALELKDVAVGTAVIMFSQTLGASIRILLIGGTDINVLL